MSENSGNSNNFYRLWSLPAFLGGVYFLAKDWGSLQHVLLGAGLLLAGIFAFRHNLWDLSPGALEPRQVGRLWLVVLCASILLVLAAAAIALAP